MMKINYFVIKIDDYFLSSIKKKRKGLSCSQCVLLSCLFTRKETRKHMFVTVILDTEPCYENIISFYLCI